jgi:hypothetical protein
MQKLECKEGFQTNSLLPDWSWGSHEGGHLKCLMTLPLQASSVSWQTSHSHPKMGPSALTAKWDSELCMSCTGFTVRTVTTADLLHVLKYSLQCKTITIPSLWRGNVLYCATDWCIQCSCLDLYLLKFSHNTFLYQSIFCIGTNINDAKYIF